MEEQRPQFPCLPGYNFDRNIGRTRFNKSHVFDRIHKNVYYLIEKPEPDGFSRYPAPSAWGEEPSVPTWIAYDGQRLKFKAYFQESVYGRKEPYRIRLVDISFFLEDGTIKICEPAITNSGLEQGILVKRQRIPLPKPIMYRYYDILDLNIGVEPKIFGRVYKIFDCDDFTRKFLTQMGIKVPEPLMAPENPNYECTKPVICKERPEIPDKFFRYDGKILRFYGYWDDSDSPYGYIHDLEIFYYLADDTMQVFDLSPASYSPSAKSILVKRIKIPRFFEKLEPIGSKDPKTLLNILGEDKGHYITDNAYCPPSSSKYYKENDFSIGAEMSIFGRRVVITHLDKFTQEYYRKKYGLEDFTPLERPGKKSNLFEHHNNYVPPYNGFGEYEDSLGNCFTIRPKRPKVITDKDFKYENQENDRRVLRFGAKMISDIPGNDSRRFILNVFLADNTIKIMEGASKSAGRVKNVFQKRMRLKLPGQNIFSNEKPKYYEAQHFFIGAYVNLMSFIFYIETADEYTLNYMEQHNKEFPKSDKDLVMSKFQEGLKSTYEDFLNEFTPIESDNHPAVITYEHLKEAAFKYLGDGITEHEVITIARHYTLCEKTEVCPREYVRALVHTELHRHLYNELDKLVRDIKDLDKFEVGHLTRNQLYTVLCANRVPLSKELINLMLDRLRRNEDGLIEWEDLVKFINIKVDPLPPSVPINVKVLYWEKEDNAKDCKKINWCKFVKDLKLEEEKNLI